MRHEMNRSQSKDHNVESYRINKISLSSYDDKKGIPKDGYNRLSKIGVVGFPIFINLLVNHIKIISSNIDNLF